MSSLRSGALSALAFAGGSMIAALYTHYQNKPSADSDSQDQTEVENTPRKSRRTKRKVDHSDSDVPLTPERSRKPRQRKTHRKPRKVAHLPSSPFDSVKQKRGGDQQIGQFMEATDRKKPQHSRTYSVGTKRMRALSPTNSCRSNYSSKRSMSSAGTGASLSSDEFGEFGVGPASPSFGPEERLMSLFGELDEFGQGGDTQQPRKKHVRVTDSPINPHQLGFKTPLMRFKKAVNDDDQKEE